MTGDGASGSGTSRAARRMACCPRCGYDQHGVVVSWTDRCPLEGRCTECGLEFRWVDVLVPEKFEPKWCVEFAPTARNVPAACVRTFLRSLWPRGFWQRMRMSYDLRPKRFVAYLAALVIILTLPYVALQTSAAIMVRWKIQSDINAYVGWMPREVARLQVFAADENFLARQASVRWPGDLEAAREERERLRQELLSRIAFLQKVLRNPPTIRFSYEAAIVEAVLLPFRRRSFGWINDPSGAFSGPYPAPRELMSRAQASFEGFGSILTTLLAIAIGVLGMSVFPCTLALLPVTRRRAKVRWRHIVRAYVYGLAMPVACVILAAGLLAAGWLPGTWGAASQTAMPVVGVLGPWIALVIWWHAAVKHYLRLPHATAVVLLLTLMTVLLMPFIIGVGVAAQSMVRAGF